MADNVVANSIPVATRSVTYSGDPNQNAQVVGAVLLTGSDDAKVATDAIPATAGLDSTGGGIPAVALVAQFDDASTTSVTENQFAHPRLSSRRALLVEGVASGTALPVSAASLPLPTGAATETTLGGVLTTSDFDTKAGSLTETAPASDTASSGLNGRLQRIAQRITSLITALGSPFQAGGSIGNTTFASTQSGTWTVATKTALTASAPTSASVGVTSGSAVASNGSRKGLTLQNLSSSTISLAFSGGAAVLNTGVTLPPLGVFVMDEYTYTTGAVFAIAGVAASTLAVQEWT